MRLSALARLAVLSGALWSAPGCRSQDSAADQRQAITARVRVAPIADDHPWVMAFLTNVSMTQPPGLDARLDGRTGPQGLRHPEPIIEGESRAALTSELEAYSKVHPRPPNLAPVFGKGLDDHRTRELQRLYFIDMNEGFTVDAGATVGLEVHDHGPSAHLYLGKAQTGTFADLTSAHRGRRLAVVIDEDVVMLPMVMSTISDGELQLIGEGGRDPEKTAPALARRLAGTGSGG